MHSEPVKNKDTLTITETSFEQLFKASYEDLCRVAFRLLKDYDKSEELVQGFFCEIWNKRASIEIQTSWGAYAGRAVRNRCIDELRKKARRGEVSDEFISEQISENGEPVFELEQYIQEAYEALPNQCRRIFDMSRNEGKKYKEIAEELSLSVKTVENQIGKALQLFRKQLAEYLPLVIITLNWLIDYAK